MRWDGEWEEMHSIEVAAAARLIGIGPTITAAAPPHPYLHNVDRGRAAGIDLAADPARPSNRPSHPIHPTIIPSNRKIPQAFRPPFERTSTSMAPAASKGTKSGVEAELLALIHAHLKVGCLDRFGIGCWGFGWLMEGIGWGPCACI